ncbi:MAG: inorganic phosphate transporter [Pseudomonadota bacterium]
MSIIAAFCFLSSGLFLGWSLGANDAANVFGTAVGSKMLRFKTAAIICSVFLILGAVISGAGASHTYGKLGSINEIGGAFIVAFAAAFSVFWMTRLMLPVSTSQAIVGAIIGWNFYAGFLTDQASLIKIVSTWVFCPILAAIFASVSYVVMKFIIEHIKIHLLWLDFLIRWALIIVGAFGSYALGANNIANVMGVFVPVSPFPEVNVFNLFTFDSIHTLFLLGGIAIAVGVFTYSKRVMSTVGSSIFSLNSVNALVVVFSSSLVLFLFASQSLKDFLISMNLPSFPLVPVSSSQAVVGAVLGIGIIKCRRNINVSIIGKISAGWVATPIIAGVVSFVLLFIMQNVFMQPVYKPISYLVSKASIIELESHEMPFAGQLKEYEGSKFKNELTLYNTIKKTDGFKKEYFEEIKKFCEFEKIKLAQEAIKKENFAKDFLSPSEKTLLLSLKKHTYNHRWLLERQLFKLINDQERARQISSFLYENSHKW